MDILLIRLSSSGKGQGFSCKERMNTVYSLTVM
jgi:hypothetical protein